MLSLILRYRSILMALLFAFVACTTRAQQNAVPPLERVISIKATNMPLDAFLNKLSESGKFSFSYNTKTFDPDRKISAEYLDKSVRYILNKTFQGSINYKSKNNYIILSSIQQKNTGIKEEPKYIQLSGYIFDKKSSLKLTDVSVFEQTSLYSSISDAYGYFSMQVPNNATEILLNFRKNGFRDTAVRIEREYFQAIEITLQSKDTVKEPTIAIEPSLPIKDTLIEPVSNKSSNRFDFLLNRKMKINLHNLTDTFFRKVEFSLVPGLSTNKLVGTNVINNISFNLLAGYTAGVKYAEVAGLINVVKGDVSYLQVAGLVNAVGGKTKGVQVGGLSNLCKDTVTGVQIGGLFNSNIKHTNGVQVAGLYNQTKTIKGAQIGGLFNWSQQVEGIQVAGLFNYAKKIKGVQIATFNFADTCEGIPIGFFSFIKRGYHKIEISSDELFYTNLAFRTGVEKFHTIFQAGIDPRDLKQPLWFYGYGMGSSYKVSKKLWFDLDLTASQINKSRYSAKSLVDSLISGRNSYLNLNNKIYIGLDWRIAKKISISAGPTVNIMLADTRNADYSTVFNTLRPTYLYSHKVDTNLQMNVWIGGKIAIRFL